MCVIQNQWWICVLHFCCSHTPDVWPGRDCQVLLKDAAANCSRKSQTVSFFCYSTVCSTFLCILLYLRHTVPVPSVLWLCWLGGRKVVGPVKKTEWWGAGIVICLKWGADLPSWCHCYSLSLASVKSRLVFTFLVPAHLGSPGKWPLNGCVCTVLELSSVLCHCCLDDSKGILMIWCVANLCCISQNVLFCYAWRKKLREVGEWVQQVCL